MIDTKTCKIMWSAYSIPTLRDENYTWRVAVRVICINPVISKQNVHLIWTDKVFIRIQIKCEVFVNWKYLEHYWNLMGIWEIDSICKHPCILLQWKPSSSCWVWRLLTILMSKVNTVILIDKLRKKIFWKISRDNLAFARG